MTNVNSPYSPLILFPERDFTTFYSHLSTNLGFQPAIKSIGLLTPEKWKEITPLMERKDYHTLLRMADARDPDALTTQLILEVQGYGTLWFGKILVDGVPRGIALNPLGNMHGYFPVPEDLTQGCLIKVAKFEPVEWLSLENTARKYNIKAPTDSYMPQHHEAKLAFLSILDGVFRQMEMCCPKEYTKLFKKDRVTIGDIGCGTMLYGTMLAHYFLQSKKHVKVIGIDGEIVGDDLEFSKEEATKLNSHVEVDFISVPYWLEESMYHLKEIGVESFDLLTMFNPRDVIDIGSLPESFREFALLLVALDDNFGLSEHEFAQGARRDEVKRNLVDNGYMIISENINHYSSIMSHGMANKYNPIMLAKRIPELLNQ